MGLFMGKSSFSVLGPEVIHLFMLISTEHDLSCVMRKPAICICENKDADQLRGNREADQHLCFLYTDSTILLLPKSEISSLSPSSVTVQPSLCQTLPETPKPGFLRTRLIFILLINVQMPLLVGILTLMRLNIKSENSIDSAYSAYYTIYEVLQFHAQVLSTKNVL